MGASCGSQTYTEVDPKYYVKHTGLPLWVSKAGQELFSQASEMAKSPYPQYQGPRIAQFGGSDFTAAEQQGQRMLSEGATSYQPYLDTAYGAARQLGQGYDQMTRGELLGPQYGGATRGQLTGGPRRGFQTRGALVGGPFGGPTRQGLIGESADIGKFSLADAQPYMDIYQQAVDPAIEAVRRQAAAQQSKLSAQAAGAGAFGGSRQAVQSAMLGAEGARAAGDLRARAAQEGLGFAAGRFEADRQARMSQAERDRAARFGAESAMMGRREAERAARFRAGDVMEQRRQADMAGRFQAENVLRQRHLADQQARLGAEAAGRAGFETQEAARLRKAQELAGYAPMARTLQERAAAGLLQTGQAQREMAQRGLDLAHADYMEQRQWPFEMLNMALGALKGVPYEQKSYGYELGRHFTDQPSIYGQIGALAGQLGSAWLGRKQS